MSHAQSLIREIQQILSLDIFQAAPIRPHDPLGGLMAYKKDSPKYQLQGEKLIGLNLARVGLSDSQWAAICALPGFKAEALQALNLSGNQLASLELGSFSGVKRLNLSYNASLTSLTLPEACLECEYMDLGHGKLKRWVLPQALPKLERLDLTANALAHISIQNPLPSLNTFQFSGNKLKQLSLANHFPKLSYLNARGNHIEKIQTDEPVPELRDLILSHNKLVDFPKNWLDRFPKLESLMIEENPLPDAIKGFLTPRDGAANIDFLYKTYYPDLAKGKAEDKECKVIIIGNGGVGKSVMVKRLIDNEFEPEWNSTHAIAIKRYEKPHRKYVLNLWDFGGQDIYHATHRLFMQSSAIYLVLWDLETEKKAYSVIQEKGRNREYENFLLPYWLHYAQVLGKNSPALVVQTKVGLEKEDKSLRPDIEKQYRPSDFAHIESANDDWEDNGYNDLLWRIGGAVKCIKSWVEIPANWIALRAALRKLADEGKKYLPFEDYQALAKEWQVEAPIGILENWLVKTGVVFYKDGLFQNFIILNQEWAILAVYTLFDRKGAYYELKDSNGLFTGADLQEIWGQYEYEPGKWSTYTDEERELFVSFMLACEICFEKTDKEQRNNLAFAQRSFIAPQLLASTKPRSVKRIWQGREALYFRYRHEFLHYGVIQSFIVRTQEFAEPDEIWRNGISIADPEDENILALVETLRTETDSLVCNFLQITVSRNGISLLNKIRKLLEELQDAQGEESVSLDGEHYVRWEELRGHDPSESATIKSLEGRYLKYEPFKIFLENHPENQKSLIEPDPMKDTVKAPRRLRGFVSYARKEDRRYMSSFVEGIKVHSDWEVFDDRCIELGADWDEVLQQQVKTCDFGILLISPYFFKSDYIKNHELNHFVARNRDRGFPIFSVLLSACNYQQWEEIARRQFFNAEGQEYDLAKDFRDKQISFDQLLRFDRDGEMIPNPALHRFYKNFVKKAQEVLDQHDPNS